jgi:hypothetical protein
MDSAINYECKNVLFWSKRNEEICLLFFFKVCMPSNGIWNKINIFVHFCREVASEGANF